MQEPNAAKPGKADDKTAGGLSASGRIDKKIAGIGDWRGERLAQIRRLIHEADPDVVEEWKWMGSPVLFNAGLEGNTWRAIDFREADKVDETALKALLREAVAYNIRHSVPRSKDSRA